MLSGNTFVFYQSGERAHLVITISNLYILMLQYFYTLSSDSLGGAIIRNPALHKSWCTAVCLWREGPQPSEHQGRTQLLGRLPWNWDNLRAILILCSAKLRLNYNMSETFPSMVTSPYFDKIREQLRPFESLNMILCKMEMDTILTSLADSFCQIFDREVTFGLKGYLSRTQQR